MIDLGLPPVRPQHQAKLNHRRKLSDVTLDGCRGFADSPLNHTAVRESATRTIQRMDQAPGHYKSLGGCILPSLAVRPFTAHQHRTEEHKALLYKTQQAFALRRVPLGELSLIRPSSRQCSRSAAAAAEVLRNKNQWRVSTAPHLQRSLSASAEVLHRRGPDFGLLEATPTRPRGSTWSPEDIPRTSEASNKARWPSTVGAPSGGNVRAELPLEVS